MRRVWWITFILALSFGLSGILWEPMFRSVPPPPVAATEIERTWGFNVDSKSLAKLYRNLPPEIKFTTLEEAVDRLRDTGRDIHIFVNWRALNLGGITKDSPVSVDVSGKPLGEAIQLILAKLSTNTAKLQCVVDEEVFTISTDRDIDKNTSTRSYDARDLTGSMIRQVLAKRAPADAAAMNRLVNDITTHIDPKSWRANGGESGAIKPLAGQLIVTQTEVNQRELATLLYRRRFRQVAAIFAARAALVFVGMLFCAGAVRRFARYRAVHDMQNAGLCPVCRYDLRATVGRCPECGTAIAAGSQTTAE